MNTQTLKTLRTCSVITIYLLLGIKPVCHDRHKTVPEFIFILYAVDENHISTFTDVKPARTFYQLRAF